MGMSGALRLALALLGAAGIAAAQTSDFEPAPGEESSQGPDSSRSADMNLYEPASEGEAPVAETPSAPEASIEIVAEPEGEAAPPPEPPKPPPPPPPAKKAAPKPRKVRAAPAAAKSKTAAEKVSAVPKGPEPGPREIAAPASPLIPPTPVEPASL